MREELGRRFGYDLNRIVEGIRPDYVFDVSCQGTVPEAVICFLDSSDFEGAVRNAVSLGGDADTLACIARAIAKAYYGEVPPRITEHVRSLLPPDLLEVADAFHERYRARPAAPHAPRGKG